MLDDLLGYPTEFRRGRIRVALDPQQFDLYRHLADAGERQGFATDVLGRVETQALVPLAGDNVFGAYHYRFGGHANPHRTAQAYAWAMEDLGGRVQQHTTVVGIETAGGRVTAVRTDRGVIGCDMLVIAAGPQTGRLAAMIGVDVPMAAARAEMIVTEPLPLMPLGGVDGNGLYGRQTLRGNLAYGGGPHEWIALGEGMAAPPRASTPLLGPLAGRLAALFPKVRHARVIRSWAGLIENTPDGRPVIERLRAPNNVVIATLSSVGFGLSPATGHAIRDLVVDGACSFADLSTLRLSRFAKLEPDWMEQRGWVPLAA
jgi:sarcosine oxidase, subunit beta